MVQTELFATQMGNVHPASAMEMFAPFKMVRVVAAAETLDAPPETVESKDFACLQTVLDLAETETPATKQTNVPPDTRAADLYAFNQFVLLESRQILAPMVTLETVDTREIALRATGVHLKQELQTSATNSELRMALIAMRR